MLQRVRGDFKSLVLPLGGACECPGFPHKDKPVPLDDTFWQRRDEQAERVKVPKPERREICGDYVVYKDRLLYGDMRVINAADPSVREATLFLQAILDWNLVDADGEDIPVSLEKLDRLSLYQSAVLVGTLDTPEYALGNLLVQDPNLVAGTGGTQPRPSATDDSSASGPEG